MVAPDAVMVHVAKLRSERAVNQARPEDKSPVRLTDLKDRLDADGDGNVTPDEVITGIKEGVDADDDGKISAKEIADASVKVAKLHVPTSFVTLPVAMGELMAAALVVYQSAVAPDMVAVVYVTGFAVGIFLIAAVHYMIATARPIWLWFFLAWKCLLSLAMAAALWERHNPHKVWDGTALKMTEPAQSLATASILMVVAVSALVIFRVFLATERLVWRSSDA